MPEESIETAEIKEQLEEAVEKAEEKRASWMTALSLSTAIIAVVAAIAALQAGSFANDALLLKNEAVLAKTEAADKYNEYEFRKVKTHVYQAQLDALPADRQDARESFKKTIDRETEAAKEPLAEARKLDAESAAKNEESEVALARHETFARSITVFQVAIAMSAIAALTRKKGMWLFSMALGAIGLFFFVLGHVPHGKAPKGEGSPAAASATPKE